MNGDSRCPCESNQAPCLCCKAAGVTNPGTMGTRTSQAQVPYSPDPVRTPALNPPSLSPLPFYMDTHGEAPGSRGRPNPVVTQAALGGGSRV